MIGYGVMTCTSDELDLIGGYQNPKWDNLSDNDIQDKCEELGVYEECCYPYMMAFRKLQICDENFLNKGFYYALVEADDETRYVGVKLYKEGKKENETI